MLYRLLADLVVTIHFAYVSFVLFGLLLTLVGWAVGWSWVRNRWFRGIHFAMILIVVLEAWAGIVCPLTVLEQWLRGLSGQPTHGGSFIANALHDVMFFDAEPWVFTVAYSAFGGLVLMACWFVPPRWRRAPT